MVRNMSLGVLVVAGVVLASPLAALPPSERYVFITSGTYSGNMGGIDGADAACQSLADAAGIGAPRTYRAWLSTASGASPIAVSSRLDHATVPYKSTLDVIIADNWTDLTDGSLDSAIQRDQNGFLVAGLGEVWTGTNESGGFYFGSCSAWSSTSFNGTSGKASETDADWTRFSSTTPCSSLRNLYCFQYYDYCPTDPNKIEDIDSDGDATLDCNDGCPSDADKTEPLVCGCGISEAGATDSDGDAVADCNDGCPDDIAKTEPLVCGCGVSEDGAIDSDGDEIADCNDNCPADYNPGQEDGDGDLIGDVCDDSEAPVISCNTPANVSPKAVPICFSASAVDNLDPNPAVVVVNDPPSPRCYKVKGKREVNEACNVTISDNQICINTSSANLHVDWKIQASDSSLNSSEKDCGVIFNNKR